MLIKILTIIILMMYDDDDNNRDTDAEITLPINVTLVSFSISCDRYLWFKHDLSRCTISLMDRYFMIWYLNTSSGKSIRYSI